MTGQSARGATGSKPKIASTSNPASPTSARRFVARPEMAGAVEIGESLRSRGRRGKGRRMPLDASAASSRDWAPRAPAARRGLSRPAMAASASSGRSRYSSTLRQIAPSKVRFERPDVLDPARLRSARRTPCEARRARPRSSPASHRGRVTRAPARARMRLNTPLPQPTSSQSPAGPRRGSTSSREERGRFA